MDGKIIKFLDMESSKPKLLITGINGYIGAWVTLKALESGEYQVRGTVRGKREIGLLMCR